MISTGRLRAVALRAGFLAFALLMFGGAITASANQAPRMPEVPVLQQVPDACTGVPDFGPGFNFTNACFAHDNCYESYGATLPVTLEKEQARSDCDTAFLNAMVASCGGGNQQPGNTAGFNGLSWALYTGCLTRAFTYYGGVVLAGWPFFYHILNPLPPPCPVAASMSITTGC